MKEYKHVRADRTFLRVHGRDPAKMVQGLITNDLALASATRTVYAGMLSPKGRLVADLRVFRRGEELLLDVPTEAMDAVLAHFRKYVPPLFARFERTDRYLLVGLYGPGSPELVANEFQIAPPQGEDDMVQAGHVTVIRSHYAGDPGFDLLVDGDTSALPDQLRPAAAQPMDEAALETLRIEAGTPRWGTELDENVIPLEAGLRSRMISETKGCYTGQEVIVRILHRGHVNWLLRGMLLEDAAPAVKGTALLNTADHKQVGKITSSCASPRAQQTIALGYARRELTLPARVHLGMREGPLVTIVELPFGNDVFAARTRDARGPG
ncbi:MAG: YgfZ/GcvT domain-containing protein [Longimicrobiales bacterium]